MTAIALTIAGSDLAGGAGHPGGFRTFAALGVHGATAITALTAQNTLAVEGVHMVPPEFVLAQIGRLRRISTLSPSRPACSAQLGVVEAVVAGLKRCRAFRWCSTPSWWRTSGDVLLDEDAIDTLRTKLMPRRS